MDLNNSYKIIIYYFIIRRMTNIGNWNEFLMVSVLMWVITIG